MQRSAKFEVQFRWAGAGWPETSFVLSLGYMKNTSQKIPQPQNAPASASRRRRLEKVLKKFIAGEVSLMSLASFDDAFARVPHRRVHE